MKTETKPTPGPWHLNAGGHLIIGADGESVIAEVYGAAVEDQEGAANARLIASAPAMLEELTTLRADKAELLIALKAILNREDDSWDYARALIAKNAKP